MVESARDASDKEGPVKGIEKRRLLRDDQESLADETTGSEGGGPSVGYGGNPHGEKPLTFPDQTRKKQ